MKNKVLLIINFVVLISLILCIVFFTYENIRLKEDIADISTENISEESQEKLNSLSHYIKFINEIEKIASKKSNEIAQDNVFYKNDYDRYFEVVKILKQYKTFYKEYAFKDFKSKFHDIDKGIVETLEKLETYYLYEGSKLKHNDVSQSDIQIAYDDFITSLDSVNEQYTEIKGLE